MTVLAGGEPRSIAEQAGVGSVRARAAAGGRQGSPRPQTRKADLMAATADSSRPGFGRSSRAAGACGVWDMRCSRRRNLAEPHSRLLGRRFGPRYADVVAGAARPAAARRASALSVFSHVKSWSSRPKWPYAAVFA